MRQVAEGREQRWLAAFERGEGEGEAPVRFRRVQPVKPPTVPERAWKPSEVRPAPEDSQREDDLALLRAVVAALSDAEGSRGLSSAFGFDGEEDPELPAPLRGGGAAGQEGLDDEQQAEARAAFTDMLRRLEGGRPVTLSPRQRRWAEVVAERLDLDWGDPARRNAAVPEGKPVALLVDSMARPLAPPGRKA